MDKIKRIVAFGCSHSKGVGQVDCDIMSIKSSKFSFINQCATHLNLDVDNLSIGGSSNKLISILAAHYQYTKNDLVIITWTHPNRFHVFNKTQYKRLDKFNSLVFDAGFISPHIENKKNNVFYKHFYNEVDMEIDFFLRCNAINLLLQKQNIPCINLLVDINNLTNYPLFNTVKFLDFDIMSYIQNYGTVIDGHMSYEGHTNLGYHLSKYLKEKYREKL